MQGLLNWHHGDKQYSFYPVPLLDISKGDNKYYHQMLFTVCCHWQEDWTEILEFPMEIQNLLSAQILEDTKCLKWLKCRDKRYLLTYVPVRDLPKEMGTNPFGSENKASTSAMLIESFPRLDMIKTPYKQLQQPYPAMNSRASPGFLCGLCILYIYAGKTGISFWQKYLQQWRSIIKCSSH